MNIKKWYLDTYKDDEGLNINDSADFNDIDHYEVRHIYDYLGVDDSIIRERVFGKLAELTGTTYQDIYDIWLNQ